jgi:hypothetical protein
MFSAGWERTCQLALLPQQQQQLASTSLQLRGAGWWNYHHQMLTNGPVVFPPPPPPPFLDPNHPMRPARPVWMRLARRQNFNSWSGSLELPRPPSVDPSTPPRHVVNPLPSRLLTNCGHPRTTTSSSSGKSAFTSARSQSGGDHTGRFPGGHSPDLDTILLDSYIGKSVCLALYATVMAIMDLSNCTSLCRVSTY